MEASGDRAAEEAPEVAPRDTAVIHGEAERKVVMAYLLARHRDQKAAGSEHMTTFLRNRQAVRILCKVMSRIPIPPDTAVNA